jgi:hypothetical protein
LQSSLSDGLLAWRFWAALDRKKWALALSTLIILADFCKLISSRG